MWLLGLDTKHPARRSLPPCRPLVVSLEATSSAPYGSTHSPSRWLLGVVFAVVVKCSLGERPVAWTNLLHQGSVGDVVSVAFKYNSQETVAAVKECQRTNGIIRPPSTGARKYPVGVSLSGQARTRWRPSSSGPLLLPR